MFIIERSGFKITKRFYALLIICMLLAHIGFGVILTMHIHVSSDRR